MFNQTKNKIGRVTSKSGCSANEAKLQLKSVWAHYEEMLFLSETFDHAVNESNLDVQPLDGLQKTGITTSIEEIRESYDMSPNSNHEYSLCDNDSATVSSDSARISAQTQDISHSLSSLKINTNSESVDGYIRSKNKTAKKMTTAQLMLQDQALQKKRNDLISQKMKDRNSRKRTSDQAYFLMSFENKLIEVIYHHYSILLNLISFVFSLARMRIICVDKYKMYLLATKR